MGAWSHEPFGNDTACDWAYELEGQRDFSHVARTIQAVLDNGAEYLEDSPATEAVAAAEVLARSLGRGTQNDTYTEDVDDWLATVDAKPSPELLRLADKALTRILGPESELRELWEESQEFDAWKASIETLQAALRA